MAKLFVITKGLPASSHELGESWVTIGRHDSNNFQIVQPSVSGRHCEVRLQGEELVIRDLQSTNGTFVAGKKISEGILKPGQTLRLGEVELSFETAADAGSSFITKNLVTNTSTPKTPPAKSEPPASAPLKTTPPESKPASQPEAAEPAKKFHVLFVDDSMAFLETFGGLCAEFSNKAWTIHSAPAADKALAILQENVIDLVVLDIGMPMVDGLQLLGIINRRYPGIKIAVMTGNATESKRADCLSNGAELFIEKPVSTDGIRVVFNMLNDLLLWAQREGFSGALRAVSLQDVIQMECVGRHSSILEVRNPQARGQIYIEAGAIIHAAVANLTGERAFHRLLSFKGGEFQIRPFKPPVQRTMQGGWELLLMEAARASDEETVLLKKADFEESETLPPAVRQEHIVLGDDIVVVATYDGSDGKWNPVDGSKK
ncbi:MAG TPA: response regulator [Candidatus Aquilonibacter sp.]|nr:response regulator [Candidatus Aquilonibacter sp.]